MTPADLLARAHRRDPARPFLTWYDATARVELSVATTTNWAAKVAGWLLDEHDVEPGTEIGVRPDVHWGTAVILLGIWTAGGAVSEAAAVVVPDPLDPMGMTLSRLVGAQPDHYAGPPADPAAPALRLGDRLWSHEQLATAAEAGARDHGLGPDSRVLSTLDYASVPGLDAGLLVPLAAGGSVVLVADGNDLAQRCAVERVTHTAGVTVEPLPRLA